MKLSSALTTLICAIALTTSISNGAERNLSTIIDRLSWRSDGSGDVHDAPFQDMKRNRELMADFEAGLRAEDAACPRMRSKALLFCSSQTNRECSCLQCGLVGSCSTCCYVIVAHQCAEPSYYASPVVPCLTGALCGMANAQSYSNYFYAPLAKLLCCLCCKTGEPTESESDRTSAHEE